MPSPIRGPKNRDPAFQDPDLAARPKIWVEGHQQPKFAVGAWARVALALTRRALGPVMADAATALGTCGQTLQRGDRVPDPGRTKGARRLIPSRQRIGILLAATAQILADAGKVVLPDPTGPDPIAYPNLIRPAVAASPAQTAPRPNHLTVVAANPMPPRTLPDAPTLQAIRALIVESGAPPPHPPAAGTASAATAQPRPRRFQTARTAARRAVRHLTVRTLGWSLVALCLPYGAVKAVTIHLNGTDLRDWS